MCPYRGNQDSYLRPSRLDFISGYSVLFFTNLNSTERIEHSVWPAWVQPLSCQVRLSKPFTMFVSLHRSIGPLLCKVIKALKKSPQPHWSCLSFIQILEFPSTMSHLHPFKDLVSKQSHRSLWSPFSKAFKEHYPPPNLFHKFGIKS